MEPQAKRARGTEGATSPYAPTSSPTQSDDDDSIGVHPDEIYGPDHVSEEEVLRQRAEHDAAMAVEGHTAMAAETADEPFTAAKSAEQNTEDAMAVDTAVEPSEEEFIAARVVLGERGYQLFTQKVVLAIVDRFFRLLPGQANHIPVADHGGDDGTGNTYTLQIGDRDVKLKAPPQNGDFVWCGNLENWTRLTDTTRKHRTGNNDKVKRAVAYLVCATGINKLMRVCVTREAVSRCRTSEVLRRRIDPERDENFGRTLGYFMVYDLMLENTHLAPPVFGGPMVSLEERLAKQVERAETTIRTIANLGLCDAVQCSRMQELTHSPPNFYERALPLIFEASHDTSYRVLIAALYGLFGEAITEWRQYKAAFRCVPPSHLDALLRRIESRDHNIESAFPRLPWSAAMFEAKFPRHPSAYSLNGHRGIYYGQLKDLIDVLYALWQQRNFHLNTFEQRKAKRNGLKHVLGAAPGTYPPPCLYTVAACGICEMASASDINDVLSRLQNFDLDADADALDPGPIAHAFVCRWNEDGVRELFHRFANLYKVHPKDNKLVLWAWKKAIVDSNAKRILNDLCKMFSGMPTPAKVCGVSGFSNFRRPAYEAAYKEFNERVKPLIKNRQPIPPDFWTSLKLVDWPNCS